VKRVVVTRPIKLEDVKALFPEEHLLRLVFEEEENGVKVRLNPLRPPDQEMLKIIQSIVFSSGGLRLSTLKTIYFIFPKELKVYDHRG